MLGALSISPAHLAAGSLPGPAPSPQQLWEVVCMALVVMQPTLLSCCALRLFSIWQRLGRLKQRPNAKFLPARLHQTNTGV